MCVGVPARVEEVEGAWAVVSYGELRAEVSVSLLPGVRVGEFVIVHAGFAIERLDEDEAQETLRLLGELREA